MRVKSLKLWEDLKEKKTRKKNDEFVVSQERFKEINSTKYGKLVVEIPETKNVKKTNEPKKEEE